MADRSTVPAVPNKLYSAYTVLTVCHRLLTGGQTIDESDVVELTRLIERDVLKNGGSLTDAAFGLLDMLLRDYSEEFVN